MTLLCLHHLRMLSCLITGNLAILCMKRREMAFKRVDDAAIANKSAMVDYLVLAEVM